DAVSVAPEVRRLLAARAAHTQLLVLPQHGLGGDLLGAFRIVAIEDVQQVVPVHDAPAVGGRGRVTVVHGDLVPGIAQLGRDRKGHPRSPRPDTPAPHRYPPPRPPAGGEACRFGGVRMPEVSGHPDSALTKLPNVDRGLTALERQ